MQQKMKDLGAGARFSHNNKLFIKQDTEFTPDGKSNARDCITDEFIQIGENVKVEHIIIRFF